MHRYNFSNVFNFYVWTVVAGTRVIRRSRDKCFTRIFLLHLVQYTGFCNNDIFLRVIFLAKLQ